jgi:hypothetical protein
MYKIINLLTFLLGILHISVGFDNLPTQIHMAQGKTPSSMTITWITQYKTKSQLAYWLVFNKTSSEKYFINSDYSTQYEFNYIGYQNYTSGYIHHIKIDNLIPDSLYKFECGDFESGLIVESYFKTLAPIGYQSYPTVFGVIGDIGQTDDSKSTLKYLNQDKLIQMILHAGDLSYADCNQTMWDTYGQMIEPVSKRIPWMVGPGNHEIEYNPFTTNTNTKTKTNPYLAFESRYRMPSDKPAQYGTITMNVSINPLTGLPYCTPSIFQSQYDYGNSFFSFETGLTHIVFLNPYTTTDTNSPQYKWLISDLEMVDRNKTPWIIIISHCPWYNSNKAHQNETQTILMRETFEPVFYKYKVNLVFTGHVHAYERTYSVYANKIDLSGPTYIVIGNGGNNEGHASTYLEKPEWSAYRNGTQYGYGLLFVKDSDKLEWKWFINIDNKFTSRDNIEIINNYKKNLRWNL